VRKTLVKSRSITSPSYGQMNGAWRWRGGVVGGLGGWTLRVVISSHCVAAICSRPPARAFNRYCALATACCIGRDGLLSVFPAGERACNAVDRWLRRPCGVEVCPQCVDNVPACAVYSSIRTTLAVHCVAINSPDDVCTVHGPGWCGPFKQKKYKHIL